MEAIRKMSYEELRDAEKRNEKLLSNRLFLEKLPDKGKKLRETHEKILERLKKCQEERELANLFSGMKVDVDKMEWAGGIEPEAGAPQTGEQKPVPDKDEDERDIVNILCTTNQLEKIVIDERKSASSDHKHEKDKFYKHLMEKADQQKHVNNHQYKPFKTLKHEKTLKPTLPPNWENTAATPPKFAHPTGVVMIPIVEALDFQIETEERVRDYEIQRSGALFPSDSLRQSSVSFSPDVVAINPEEDEQVYDDDEQNEGGLVVNIPWPEEPTVPH